MNDKDLCFNIGSKIRYERMKKRLSQEKLAELANMHMRTISLIETGQNDIKISTLNHIAAALDVELTSLLDFRFN